MFREQSEQHLHVEMYEGFLVELRRRVLRVFLVYFKEKQLLKERMETQQKLEEEEWEKVRGPLPNWYQFKTKKFTEEMERFNKERRSLS